MKRGKRAFTLIEVVAVITILSIVGLITIHYVVSASRLYVLVLEKSRADSEITAALNRMRREVRLLKTTLVADVDEFSFDNSYETKTFELSGSNVLLNSNILAKDVDTFELTYYDATNVLLSPLPLGPLARDRICRLAVEFKVVKGNQSAKWDVNLFYPEEGTVK